MYDILEKSHKVIEHGGKIIYNLKNNYALIHLILLFNFVKIILKHVKKELE
jgi:hypothetical protein